ncbi:type I-E CRISPR-associated protein Cas5/CasD [Streptomyces sp. NPDC004111]|uniref:type I-E CRISPR-associated protein Cas5/CasD n=1 Tax=Streptomyces sp. NPDC004111 TaxID=3364690 RepID=UPI0036A53CE1
MSGLLLRLAGPLQSWGERSVFSPERDSAGFPTRSGLIGMFAAAEGLPRHTGLERYAPLEFTVRIDRPGTPLTDYQTSGGGLPDHLTPATSGGKHKGNAVITRRHYLADAVFTVAATGPSADIARIATALQHPHWAPYLGRRACLPDEPFLLRSRVADPVEELLHRVPLSPPAAHGGRRPSASGTTLAVPFLWERYRRDQLPADAVAVSAYDQPRSFAPHSRSYGKRTVHRTLEQLPTTLAADQSTLHRQLIDYAQEDAV